MVPPASDKIPRASPYSGSRSTSSRFRLRDLHPLRSAFQCRSPTMILAVSRSYYPSPQAGLGSFPVRSPLLWESFLFSFPPGTKMFQFPGYLSRRLCIHLRMTCYYACGFPHSDTGGSLLTYSSPSRFAVRCVLLQFQVPRHPPYALSYLITISLTASFEFSVCLTSTREFLTTFRYRPSVMSSVIQFSKIDSGTLLSLPKPNRKYLSLHSFSLERR